MLAGTPDPRFSIGKPVKLSAATLAVLAALAASSAAGAATSQSNTGAQPTPLSGY
jgi:hypothetical protein